MGQRKQKLIHLHGVARYEKRADQVAIEKGEIVVTHAATAENTELAVLSNTDAVVYFPSLDKVNAITTALDTRLDEAAKGYANTALDTAKAYADTLDTAMDGRVEALEETVKTLTGEGETGGVLALAKQYTNEQIEAVNSEVEKKADATETTNALNLKADKSAMEEALALKANAADVATTVEGINAEVAKKADATETTNALALKADKSAMEEALALKADADDVYTKGEVDAKVETINGEIAKKADVEDVYTKDEVDAKVETINGEIALKANAADVATTVEGINAEVAKKANQDTTYTKTEVNDLLSPKATTEYVDAQLALKADNSTTYTKGEVDTKVEGVDTKITTHANTGDIHVTAQQKTDWQAATDAINAFIASADKTEQAVDTLKEIQDFLTSDDGTVQTLLDDVAKNKQDIANEKTARENADNGFETRIATLEGKFTGEDSVADQIADAVAAEAALRIAEDAKKADKATTYTKTEVNDLLSPKATTEYVDAQLALKADKSTTYTKDEVDAELAKKADQQAMTTALAGKADATETTNALALKANADDVYTKGQVDTTVAGINAEVAKKADADDVYTKTEVDTTVAGVNAEVAKKANATDVATTVAEINAEVAKKADQDAMTTALAGKADKTTMETALAGKADKTDVYTKTEVNATVETINGEIAKKANDTDVLKTVTVTEGNNITVTPTTNTVNLDFSAMVIDCGEY